MALSRLHVLVIDDDILLQRAFVRMFSRDFDVHTFTDAESALAAIDAGLAFDAVLCDLRLSSTLSGDRFYMECLRRSADLAARVILMSGASADEVDTRVAALPSSQWLTKPVSRATVIRLLEEVTRSLGTAKPAA